MSLLKQWRFVSLAIVAVLALTALAACGDDDSGGSPTPTGGATTAGGDDMAPADQQKLVTQSGEPQFFDPHRSNFEQDIAIERMLFRGLYRLVSTSSGGAEVEPAYADGEPTVSADGKVFTVKIKSGLTWSDGEPITAEQFADGVKRGCDPSVASPYAYLLQSAAVGGIIGVKGCDEYSAALGTADAPLTPTDAELAALRDAVGAKAIDDTTLEITLVDAKLPSTFEDVFSLWVTFPARMDVIQQFGDQWTDPANIVVNGPFTLTEYVPQDHVTLKPNANYGLDGKAKLQQLTVKFIDDYSVAELAFKNGELDQTRVPDTDVPTLQADSTYADQTLVVGSARITALEMQLTDPVLAKDKVRLALSQAIDRDKLAEVTTSNVGLPAEYWLVKGLPGYQGRDKFKTAIGYNPTAAKQALADAGYADGAGFPELELTVLDTPVRKAQADFLKAAFKDVLNIDIKITAVDAKTRSAAFNSGNFQLFIGGWQLDYPDPENPIIGLFDTGGGNNKYNCSDAGIDAAITAGSKATTLADHIAQFQNAEDLIVTKVCGVAPFLQEGLPYLVSPKMGGVQANGTIDAGQPGNWCAECWYVKKS
jgi:oligopeptide transport system substrate-binding protein